MQTIVPPADSKNSVSVGALELRDVYADKLLMNSTVAWFSSMGPTSDGRIKPEVVAPGSVIMSAFASSGNTQFSNIIPSTDQCATIGMSGTSMATPVIAGILIGYIIDYSIYNIYI
jgi:subtilisin family serine protease